MGCGDIRAALRGHSLSPEARSVNLGKLSSGPTTLILSQGDPPPRQPLRDHGLGSLKMPLHSSFSLATVKLRLNSKAVP